jgi:hypothetical protein
VVRTELLSSSSKTRDNKEGARVSDHLAFIHGPPEQPPASTGYDVALVRDGRIAVLYTLVTTGG